MKTDGYIGENNSDIVKDLFTHSTYTRSELMIGTFKVDGFENKYSAQGGAASHIAITTHYTVNIFANVKETYEYDDATKQVVASKEFIGIDVNVHISGSSSYPTDGGKPYETPIFNPVLVAGDIAGRELEVDFIAGDSRYNMYVITDANNTTGDLFYKASYTASEISSTFGESYTLPLNTKVNWMSGRWSITKPTALGTFGIPNTLNETIYIRYHNNDAPDRATQENWINNY